jgi:glycosyltransferase involved in cell wall biosynthesis
MRVLHLSSLYPPFAMGGAERVVELIAEHSAAHGIATAVAHLVPSPTQSAQRNGVAVYPLRHRNPLWIETSARYPGPVRNLNKIATLFNLLTERDLDKLLKQFAPDILHSHSMVELTPRMWRAAKLRGIKIVHTLHDYDLLCIRGALFKNGRSCTTRHTACSLFSRVKKIYHACIDHVVGVSEVVLRTHLENGFFRDLPPQNRHVVWNPVRTPARPREQPARCGPFTFGFLGRLVPEKGIEILLRACRSLPPQGWQLKVAGRAPTDSSVLRDSVRGLPVEFVGFVDPMSFLNEIDVLVVPSIWTEPFGLTVVEAYAAGVRVLGADSGGIGEVIRAVDPAWLVPPGDDHALADRMRALIHCGREGLGAGPDASVAMARTHPEFVAAQYLDIYTAALEQPQHLKMRMHG